MKIQLRLYKCFEPFVYDLLMSLCRRPIQCPEIFSQKYFRFSAVCILRLCPVCNSQAVFMIRNWSIHDVFMTLVCMLEIFPEHEWFFSWMHPKIIDFFIPQIFVNEWFEFRKCHNFLLWKKSKDNTWLKHSRTRKLKSPRKKLYQWMKVWIRYHNLHPWNRPFFDQITDEKFSKYR